MTLSRAVLLTLVLAAVCWPQAPLRERVGHDAAQARVLRALTPARPDAMAQGTAPSPVRGSWQRLAHAPNSLHAEVGWFNLAYDSRRDRVYELSYRGALWAFDVKSLRWAQLAPSIDDRHNCAIAYDPINDRLWLSRCAPQVQDRFFYYDLASSQWRQHCPNPCGALQVDPALVFDPAGKRLLSWGGWTAAANRTVALSLQPLAPSWSTLVASGGPPIASEPEKNTHVRSGWDSRRHRAWFVAGDGALWTLSGAAWQRRPTTGGPPSPYTVFAYHEGADLIVGWTGLAGPPGSTDARRETWLLSPVTLTWSLGPSGRDGSAPPAGGYSASAMVYVPTQKRIFLQTGPSWTNEVWALELGPPAARVPAATRQSAGAPAPASRVLAATRAGPGQTRSAARPFPRDPMLAPSAEVDREPRLVGAARSAGGSPGKATRNRDELNTVSVAWIAQSQAGGPTPSLASPPDRIEIPPGTFLARPLAPRGDGTTPFPRGGGTKHVRLAYNPDDRRIYTLGGDFSTRSYVDSENPMAFSVSIASFADPQSPGDWRLESNWCHPAGQITPARPDEVIWAYDPRREVFWTMPGIMTAEDGSICRSPVLADQTQDGSTFRKGLLAFDPRTKRWAFASGAGTNSLAGHYDPVRDGLIYIEQGGCGTQIVHLNVQSAARRAVPFCHTPSPAFVGGTGYGPPIAHYDHWALDLQGRAAYIIAPHPYYQNHKRARQDAKLWRYDLDGGRIRLLADPPRPPHRVRHDVIHPVWDSASRKVIWMYTPDHCGVIEGVYVYDPASNTWTSEPIRQPDGLVVRGALKVYDPDQNVVLVAGSVLCGAEGSPALPPQTHLFLWRYAQP